MLETRIVKSLGEIFFNLQDDPEKEKLRQRLIDEARAWEESEPSVLPPTILAAPLLPPFGDLDVDDDPLLARLRAALPDLTPSQRKMLETLLDSWGA